MREIARSNDPVFLSYLQAELAADGIGVLVLDAFASSVLEPMNMTALQRVMVAEDDYWAAWAVVEEAEDRISEDSILDGRMILLQPKSGFRAAIDPILLAATVPCESNDQVLDCGTGTGAAALALAARLEDVSVTGIDVQPGLVALAARSAMRNDVAERVRFDAMDIADPPPSFARQMFDHVMSNPPFLDAGTGQVPADAARALATVESTADLKTWIGFMADRLRDAGTLSVIHRHDRIDEIMAALGTGFGRIRCLDLVPVDDGRPIKRTVLQAVKGAPMDDPVRRTLVLHDAGGSFTDAAEAVLRDAKALPIS